MRISHIENRIEEQAFHIDVIKNAVDQLTSVGLSNISTHRVETRKEALKEIWGKFSVTNDAIKIAMRQLDPADLQAIAGHRYFEENQFNTTYESYLEAIETMNALWDRLKDERTRSPSVQSGAPSMGLSAMCGPRLPPLNLPSFDGSPSEWLAFKDLFDSMVISNPNLSPVWKLHYLKQCLKGTAAHLLKNTALTTDNFQKAWDALVSFYENKRLLINSALQSLFNIKRMVKESAHEMETLYTTITQIYRTFETLGRPVEMWDDFMVFIAVQRMDPDSVKAWESHLGSSKDPPTWKQFIEFLMTRLLTMQAVEKSRKSSSSSNQQPMRIHHVTETPNATPACKLCAANHYIARCPDYASQTIDKKMAIIVKHKLCYNCLGPHQASNCRSTKRCIKCGKKHHSSIHKSTQSKNENSSTSEPSAQANCAAAERCSSRPRTLLATAQVVVDSNNGNQELARAFIDPGSQISFISERLTQRLHLRREKSTLLLRGIGSSKAGKTKGMVSVILKPHFKSTARCILSAHVLPKLTSKLYGANSHVKNLPHLKHLQLADPGFCTSGYIDVIIGADYYGQVIEEGLRRGGFNTPTAQATIFGWVLLGSADSAASTTTQSYHVSVDEALNESLQRFWALDELPQDTTTLLSAEDQDCENHFKTTHSRDNTGRYIVELPFKKSIDHLGDSKTAALRMLSTSFKRLQLDPPLHQAYHDFLTEYEALSHMRRIPATIPEPPHTYYIPHHGVLRPSSLTTKLRVVFNASAKTTTGISLNDLLHTGQKLQLDLVNVLLWFRQFRYVFMTDIEKMYRQIKVSPSNWDFQRIFWKDESGKVEKYQLTTVTYGMACAPFLALRTMLQLVEDEGLKFPLAMNTLQKGRYVDDLFGGANTLEEARSTVQQVNGLCKAGGFPLKKWISNQPEIIQDIPQADQLLPAAVPIDRTTTVCALGMSWNPTTDTFHYTWTVSGPDNATKRSVLSTIARFFDPLGLLNPIIISAKILLQELWSLRLDWDDPLTQRLAAKWTTFTQQLQELPILSIPRWLKTTPTSSWEIHGFCDASQQALAATVHLRTIDQSERVETTLICSKTKVAPLKRLTIPRLELSAAVLLSKLVHHVTHVLKTNDVPVHLWTDSAITYTWISNHPSRWKEFVHNRVCFIQETLPTAKWHFVAGKENPADCATRGLTPVQLSQHSLWWKGPAWLQQPSSMWPAALEVQSPQEHLEEQPVHAHLVTTRCNGAHWDLLDKYSTLTRLLRITATCKRVLLCMKKRADSLLRSPITPQELEDATCYWIQRIQRSYFAKEINLLSKGDSIKSSSPLVRLTPYLDSQGLLRLGGRIHASLLPFDAKHPFILPRDSRFTELIIADSHLKTLHGGTSVTLAHIRNHYWILGGRIPIRTYIWKCVKCARYRKVRSQQLMGRLPVYRVTSARPFLHSGVDYAGPIQLKTWKGKNAKTYKAYMALFVCEATSALHLELVTDYTSEAFLAAYRRFTSRRGICATIRSDCGTNFIKGDSDLQALFSAASMELGKMASLLATDGTQWLFNPPAAPHFGGLWEAGVKSVKYHL